MTDINIVYGAQRVIWFILYELMKAFGALENAVFCLCDAGTNVFVEKPKNHPLFKSSCSGFCPESKACP